MFRNNFILQTIANLTGLPVIRPNSVEMSVWGVASLAGLEVNSKHWAPDLLRTIICNISRPVFGTPGKHWTESEAWARYVNMT